MKKRINLSILEVENIIDELSSLSKQSLELYTLIVNDIIQNNSKDEQKIENILDGLLDFCFNDEALKLYKKMCRHYYEINPHATAQYIKYYREIYEEGEKQ